jgi:hypothetical protein
MAHKTRTVTIGAPLSCLPLIAGTCLATVRHLPSPVFRQIGFRSAHLTRHTMPIETRLKLLKINKSGIAHSTHFFEVAIQDFGVGSCPPKPATRSHPHARGDSKRQLFAAHPPTCSPSIIFSPALPEVISRRTRQEKRRSTSREVMHCHPSVHVSSPVLSLEQFQKWRLPLSPLRYSFYGWTSL